MKGLAPIRRTWKYLESGSLIFKERVKILSINYNHTAEQKEAREFIFWYLPQIQYKNPEVQIVTLKNLTPTPFIRCFLDNGEQVLMDIDGKSKEDILGYLKKMLGRPEADLKKTDDAARLQISKKTNFGDTCERHCICEIPGQVPCSSIIIFPNHMRGKYKYGNQD